jgi:heme a synthase
LARYWFISTKYRHSSKLALITFILAFFVILLGAYTRLTDAGLSCPDWPQCYGFLTAPHTQAQIQAASSSYPGAGINVKKAWTEMIHRYFAGTEGILILIFACSILFNQRSLNYKSLIIGLGLIALLGLQVTLGMLTVTEKLKPVIVLSHLLTGLSILSFLWWAYLDLQLRDDSFIRGTHSASLGWFWLAFGIIITQITLGGWVSTHYAGLACIDLPYCNGVLLPTMQWHNLNSDLITIHMLHRIGAVITAIYIGIFACYLLGSSLFRALGTLLLILLCTQITLGVLNILQLRPVIIALLHHGVAILLLLTIMTALIKAHYVTRKNMYARWIA